MKKHDSFRIRFSILVILLASCLCLFLAPSSIAQSGKNPPEVSLVFGLNQPIVLQGFNAEIDIWTRKWVFDYSHGVGLQLADGLVSPEAQSQKLNFNIAHSVGFGVGYRFTEGLNLRVEPKLHQWEMYYEGQIGKTDQMITRYNTYTLGLGAYYRWMPFQRTTGALGGLTVVPSFRWWPNIATSLENDQFTYFNTQTQQNETHLANNIGMGNTPFFFNISLGYTFRKSKRQ